jgi:PBP1b-binding outer membrane lipoprotein LpoB
MTKFKAVATILGLTLCLAACQKTKTQNSATDTSVNAAAMTDVNGTDQNAALDQNASANTADNGERTDTGPRGNPHG